MLKNVAPVDRNESEGHQGKGNQVKLFTKNRFLRALQNTGGTFVASAIAFGIGYNTGGNEGQETITNDPTPFVETLSLEQLRILNEATQKALGQKENLLEAIGKIQPFSDENDNKNSDK